MTRLPLVNAAGLARLLEASGFTLRRQRGSHLVYAHADGRVTVIPQH